MGAEELRKIRMFWGDSEYNITRNAGRGEYVIVQKAKEDVGALLSLIDQYKKESELTKSYFVTIGNIARRQDNIHLQEINRHVDDILDSLEKAP